MSSWLEVLKTVGSFSGLLSVIVLFYDRLVKGQPIASLAFTNDKHRFPFVRLENPSTYSIVVLGVSVQPPVFGLSESREPRNVIDPKDTLSFLLRAGEGKDLFLISRFHDGMALELANRRVRVRVSWRRGNATWLPQYPVSVWTHTRTIREFSFYKRNYS